MNWYILTLLAGVFLGLDHVVRKKGLNKEYAVAFLTAAATLIAIFSLPLIFTGRIQSISGFMFFLILIKSLTASLFFILGAKALRHMDISEYAPLLNISPIFLLFLPMIFLGERLNIIQLGGIAFVIIGTYILELKDGLLSPFYRIGKSKSIHLMFVGMIFASVSAVLDRYILTQSINIETFYLYQRVMIALILFVVSTLFYKGYKDIIAVCKHSFIWVLLSGVFFIVGDFLYFMAVAIPAAMISLIVPVKRISTLVATIIGGEFLKEKNLSRKILACILMLAGVFLIIR